MSLIGQFRTYTFQVDLINISSVYQVDIQKITFLWCCTEKSWVTNSYIFGMANENCESFSVGCITQARGKINQNRSFLVQRNQRKPTQSYQSQVYYQEILLTETWLKTTFQYLSQKITLQLKKDCKKNSRKDIFCHYSEFQNILPITIITHYKE